MEMGVPYLHIMSSNKNLAVSFESRGLMTLYSNHFDQQSIATTTVTPPLGAGGFSGVMQSIAQVVNGYSPLKVGNKYGGLLNLAASIYRASDSSQ